MDSWMWRLIFRSPREGVMKSWQPRPTPPSSRWKLFPIGHGKRSRVPDAAQKEPHSESTQKLRPRRKRCVRLLEERLPLQSTSEPFPAVTSTTASVALIGNVIRINFSRAAVQRLLPSRHILLLQSAPAPAGRQPEGRGSCVTSTPAAPKNILVLSMRSPPVPPHLRVGPSGRAARSCPRKPRAGSDKIRMTTARSRAGNPSRGSVHPTDQTETLEQPRSQKSSPTRSLCASNFPHSSRRDAERGLVIPHSGPLIFFFCCPGLKIREILFLPRSVYARGTPISKSRLQALAARGTLTQYRVQDQVEQAARHKSLRPAAWTPP